MTHEEAVQVISAYLENPAIDPSVKEAIMVWSQTVTNAVARIKEIDESAQLVKDRKEFLQQTSMKKPKSGTNSYMTRIDAIPAHQTIFIDLGMAMDHILLYPDTCKQWINALQIELAKLNDWKAKGGFIVKDEKLSKALDSIVDKIK